MPEAFPILGTMRPADAERLKRLGCDPVHVIAWDMIAPHEAQARRNHSQSLAELAGRGGLSACEAVAVLENRAWQKMDDADAHFRLLQMLVVHNLSKP